MLRHCVQCATAPAQGACVPCISRASSVFRGCQSVWAWAKVSQAAWAVRSCFTQDGLPLSLVCGLILFSPPLFHLSLQPGLYRHTAFTVGLLELVLGHSSAAGSLPCFTNTRTLPSLESEPICSAFFIAARLPPSTRDLHVCCCHPPAKPPKRPLLHCQCQRQSPAKQIKGTVISTNASCLTSLWRHSITSSGLESNLWRVFTAFTRRSLFLPSQETACFCRDRKWNLECVTCCGNIYI